MYATLRAAALVAVGSLAIAGCSSTDLFGTNSASDVTTSSVVAAQPQRVDPACGNLALEIDTLRREGVAEKVEKASAKKYKMTATDLSKANQLNRANADFQAKCSTLPRSAAMPTAPEATAAPAPVAPAKKAAPAKAPAKAAAVGAPAVVAAQ